MSVLSSSSTAALTQLRWQSVRVIEMNMSLEIENDRLRKELDVIRSRYESLSEHSSDAAVVQANALRNSLLSTRRELSELKASQEALRAEFMSQMYGLASDQTTMAAKSSMLRSLVDAQSEESLRLREELYLLQQMHQMKGREQLETEVRMASVMRDLQEEVDFLRAERVRLTAEAELHQNELLSLRISLTDSQQQCQEMERERNGLRAESTFLMDTLTKIREEHEYVRSDMINSHEERMSSLGLELLSMRLKVADLEEMIKKLRGAQVSDKTHFGKFVELKTVNAELQARLKHVVDTQQHSVISSAGNNVPSLPSGRRRATSSIDPTISPPSSPWDQASFQKGKPLVIVKQRRQDSSETAHIKETFDARTDDPDSEMQNFIAPRAPEPKASKFTALNQAQMVSHRSSFDGSNNSGSIEKRETRQPTRPTVSAKEADCTYTKNSPTDNFKRSNNIQFSGVGAGANAAAGLKAKRVEI